MKSSYKFQSKKYWNWELIPLEMKTNFQVFFKNLMLKSLIREIRSSSFLQRFFFCMTSLDVTSSTLKTSLKFWGTAFKFWLRPWSLQKNRRSPSCKFIRKGVFVVICFVTFLILWAPIPRNGQTHSKNSSANCRKIVWVCLTI